MDIPKSYLNRLILHCRKHSPSFYPYFCDALQKYFPLIFDVSVRLLQERYYISEPATLDRIDDELWFQQFSDDPDHMIQETLKNIGTPASYSIFDENNLSRLYSSCSIPTFLQILHYCLCKLRYELVKSQDVENNDNIMLLHQAFVIQNLLTFVSKEPFENRQLIFSFVHQQFIENTALLRLIAFQGFMLHLQEDVIKMVPSFRKF